MKERIKDLCKKKGVSMNALESELGFAKGYISKLGKTKPSSEYLQRIATYFNVSTDYILTGEEKNDVPMFDAEHVELISLYSQLKKEQKETILNLLRSFAQ